MQGKGDKPIIGTEAYMAYEFYLNAQDAGVGKRQNSPIQAEIQMKGKNLLPLNLAR